MKITWVQALSTLYGVGLNDDEIKLWEHYLAEEGLTSEQMAPAIEAAAMRHLQPSNKWKVTAIDVIRWTKMYLAKNKKQLPMSKSDIAFANKWKDKIENGCGYDEFLNEVFRLNVKGHIKSQIKKIVIG